MSFILDALRRADAERARGRVPDLHAQPLGESAGARRDTGRALVWAAAGALAVVVLAAAVWLLWPAAEAPPVTVVARPVDPPAPVAAPAAVPEPAEASRVAAVTPTQTAPPPTTASAEARPVETPARAAPQALQPVAPTPAPKGSPEPARIVALADLAADQRAGFPALRLGGAIGSPDPKSRVLIVDGVLLRQGDEAAPGLVLREIRLRSVVVEWRGLWIEVPF